MVDYVNPEILRQMLAFSPGQAGQLLPFLWVAGLSVLQMLWAGAAAPKAVRAGTQISALGLLLAAMLFGWDLVHSEQSHTFFNQMLRVDAGVRFFGALICLLGSITLCSMQGVLERNKILHAEFAVQVVFACLGMILLVASVHFIAIFVALELMSLNVYGLVGFRRASLLANEASLKYFVMGSFATALFLYGVALIYGATGDLNLENIAQHLQSAGFTLLLSAGLLLAMVGFFLKVAAVPFHFWLPDAYEGALSGVTGFMATSLKAACFGVLMRIWFSFGFHPKGNLLVAEPFFLGFMHLLGLLCVLTLILGNFVALKQTSIKRVLSYSAIAHTGYLLVGLTASAMSPAACCGILVYLLAYGAATQTGFVLLSGLESTCDQSITFEDLRGLGLKHPWVCAGLCVVFLSLAGIPPTAGFFAKFTLFFASMEAGFIGLTVIAALCSAVAAGFYLKALVAMVMQAESPCLLTFHATLGEKLLGCLLVLALVLLGICPQWVYQFEQPLTLSFSAGW
jgi:NADH-quinone oxidoreductase subunit N